MDRQVLLSWGAGVNEGQHELKGSISPAVEGVCSKGSPPISSELYGRPWGQQSWIGVQVHPLPESYIRFGGH